jgi:hypothetical protein
VRQIVAAVEVSFGEDAGHTLNGSQVEVAVAINHADLGPYELKIPCDGVERAAKVPRSVHQGGYVNDRGPDGC